MTDDLRTIDDSPRDTAEEAAAVHLIGWNLRCNRCGLYGATWLPGMRPRWGALALCGPHRRELEAEQTRHSKAMAELTAVRYEQEGPR